MPKATMHKDNLSARWEDKIGATRKTLVVQYITITEPMDHATYHHFRQCILRANSSHASAGTLIDEFWWLGE